MEIRREFDNLTAEETRLKELLGADAKQWKTISEDIAKVKETFGTKSSLGKRRTTFEDAPTHDLEDLQQAMIEKEPVTIVISEKGWLRALKGHLSDYSTLTFKEDDRLKIAFPAVTTDKIIIVSTGGKFFTIAANDLPGGRGHGEPIRILVDMDNDQDILTAFVFKPDEKLLLVSHMGNGFIASGSDIVATTRKGKQIMNVKLPDETKLCIPVNGDHVAIVGENRKLLVFPLSEIPEMSRGKGVRLQRYKDGGVSDINTFNLSEGLNWRDTADRTFTKQADELVEWLGARAGAGRMVPKGFPRSGKFSG